MAWYVALTGDAGDFAVEGVIAGAGLLGLLVQSAQAEAEGDRQHGENANGDAQSLEGGTDIGEGAGGEIECDTHGLTCPRECTGDAGNACCPKRRCHPGLWPGGQLDDAECRIVDPLGELGGLIAARVMKAARGHAKLVFKVGCGHGNAALNFRAANGRIFRQVESAMEQQVVSVGDGGGQRQRTQIGSQHGFHGIDGLKSSQAGGQHRARLVSGGADGGFIFAEDGTGQNRCEDLALGRVSVSIW